MSGDYSFDGAWTFMFFGCLLGGLGLCSIAYYVVALSSVSFLLAIIVGLGLSLAALPFLFIGGYGLWSMVVDG